MRKNIVLSALVLFISLTFILSPVGYSPLVSGADDEAVSRAKELLDSLPKLKGQEFWSRVNEIEKLGKGITPAIESGLKGGQSFIRLACAKIIYVLGGKSESVMSLLSLLKEEKDKEIRRSASDVLGNLVRNDSGYGNKDDIAEMIEKQLDDVLDPTVRLNLDRALFFINGSIRAITDLKDLIKLGEEKTASGEIKYPNLRTAAALSLAELGHFEGVSDILKELAKEPAETGRLARTLLDYRQLYQDYERVRQTTRQEKPRYDYRILTEMFDLIRENYVDSKKFNLEELITAAAKGVANSLDRFSGYQTEKEKKESQEDLNKKYGGIGAYVSMRDDLLTIERPIYSGPAYKAGLQSLDKITEVEGVSTKGKSIDELITKLKGDPGTEVKVKVYRKGWAKEKDVVLTRAFIQIETAHATVLPGNIGVLSITTFGQTTDDDVAKCLKYLKEEKVKTIIIDIRKNPGGLLDTVVNIVEMFLEENKNILTTKDKDGTVLQKFDTKNADKIDLPMYVLVDGGSASASEILSGVLQDHKRAKLVGEKTFGKGSVQNIWNLSSTNGKTAFRLTIAKYYLPSGRCIHKENGEDGGIEPDIKIKESERDPWKDFAFNKVYESGALNKYGETYYAENKELFKQLADDDELDYKRYPAFAEFYKGLLDNLQIHLSENDVREILRDYIRKMVSDERGREFFVDIQIDAQLQRAIIEALKDLKINPETIAVYKPFAHKFDKTEESAK